MPNSSRVKRVKRYYRPHESHPGTGSKSSLYMYAVEAMRRKYQGKPVTVHVITPAQDRFSTRLKAQVVRLQLVDRDLPICKLSIIKGNRRA